jgi:colanic acid biosynthesis protein WcaH
MFIPEKEYKAIIEKLPIICVDLLIIYDRKCLLLKRNNEPAKGEYWFAGGRIHKLESIENAAIRIALEETNLKCKFIKIVSVEESIFKRNNTMHCDLHTVNVCCEMKTNNISSFKIDNNHNDFIWMNKIDPNYHLAVKKPLIILGF